VIATFQAALVPALGRHSTIIHAFSFEIIAIPSGIILALIIKRLAREKRERKIGRKKREREVESHQ
jgi:hypothetical protein